MPAIVYRRLAHTMIHLPNPNFDFELCVSSDIHDQWWDPNTKHNLVLALFPNLLIKGIEKYIKPYKVFDCYKAAHPQYLSFKHCYTFLREDGFEFSFSSYLGGGKLNTRISFIPNANLNFRRDEDYLLDKTEIQPFVDWAVELVQSETPFLNYHELLNVCYAKGYRAAL